MAEEELIISCALCGDLFTNTEVEFIDAIMPNGEVVDVFACEDCRKQYSK